MNKVRHIIITFLILLFALGQGLGQTLTGSCKYSKVPLGKSFQITYTLSGGNATSFSEPTFTNFSVVNEYSGSYTSITNSIVTTSETYTFLISPTAIGKYTIDAAKALVNGKWVTSNTIPIEVTSGTTAGSTQSTGTSKGSTTSGSKATTAQAGNKDLFVTASVDKLNPYEGEQVIVTYKYYRRVSFYQYSVTKLPTFKDFWSEPLTNDKGQIQESYETVGGVKYVVGTIKQFVLFPQKSGTLTLDPMSLDFLVQVESQQKYNDPFASFFNDPFFNNLSNSFFTTYSNEKRAISSNALTINVKPLPITDQPADFTGSVGKFTIEAKIDKTTGKTNDAINLTYKVSGIGNISLIEKPAFDFPADLETYDPEIKSNVIANAAGVSGSKTFSYLIMPRSAGDFTIKPVDFVYFDLATNKYVTLTSPEFNLKISKGSGDENTSISSANKEDIKYLNSDIRYIKTGTINLSEIGSFFYGSPLFFLLLLAPVVLFILFVIIYRKKLKENSNIALVRNKKATGVARKRLKAAEAYLKENKKEPFLDEVFKALWGYVSDKLSIPLSELSKETVNDKFNEKNVHEEIAKQFIATLNNCEYARFAPEDGSVTPNTIYSEAIDIIAKMESELK